MLNYRNSYLDVQKAKPEIALFSIGAIEQHTAVLPLGTDTMIIDEIADRVGRKLGAYVVPTVPFGTSYEHRGFPGTVFIRPDTLYKMIKEMISSCYDAGIKKAAVMLGHGGLWIVKPAIRDLNFERPDGTAIWLCPFDKAASLLRGTIDTIDKEIHAGEFETSAIMAIDPTAVNMQYARDFEPDAGREYLDYVPMKAISPEGTWGCQKSSTPEKGEKALGILTEATADYIKSTFAKLDSIKNKQGGVE
jgi:creatinine amidohydrolase